MGADLRGLRLGRASEMVAELLDAGVSKDEIAVACNLSWWTIFRWQRAERAPHPAHFEKLSQLHAARVISPR